MNIYEKLGAIQQELNVPKTLRNSFGNYNYRSAELILEAVKPICARHKCVLYLSDDIIDKNGKNYVFATATLADFESGEKIVVGAEAREAGSKKGMDDAQLTGATSSYARKYALNGLFCIDDNKDPDTDEYRRQDEEMARRAPKEDPKPVPAPQPQYYEAPAGATQMPQEVIKLQELMKRDHVSPEDIEEAMQLTGQLKGSGFEGKPMGEWPVACYGSLVQSWDGLLSYIKNNIWERPFK